jgi:hypothetical protein
MKPRAAPFSRKHCTPKSSSFGERGGRQKGRGGNETRQARFAKADYRFNVLKHVRSAGSSHFGAIKALVHFFSGSEVRD